MSKNLNPKHYQGYRNVFCPYYGDCLDHAVKNWWEHRTCLDCQHRDKECRASADLSQDDETPYYQISSAIEKALRGVLD